MTISDLFLNFWWLLPVVAALVSCLYWASRCGVGFKRGWDTFGSGKLPAVIKEVHIGQ